MSIDMNAMMNTSTMVLTKPSKASFDSAKRKVNTSMTLLGLVVAGAIVGFLGGLRAGDIGAAVVGLVTGAIFTVIGYYIGQVILWVVAKILGGKGDLQLQANLLGTFYVPLAVVAAILGLIPFVGGLLGLVLWLYELVLLTFGLEATHEYTTLKAVLTWLIPAIVFGIIAFFIVGAALLTMIGLGAAMSQ